MGGWRNCLFCFTPVERLFEVCLACEKRLPWIYNPCPRCALAQQETICRVCACLPPSYDRIQALFRYEWPVKVWIRRLKYQSAFALGRLLGQMMASYLKPAVIPDCVLAVPLSLERQRQRGFNQALELARWIAKGHRWPLVKDACVRVQETSSQFQLSRQERYENLSEASFAISRAFHAKSVLLVDDVVTTGATVNALTRALKQAGILEVEVWAACRTQRLEVFE